MKKIFVLIPMLALLVTGCSLAPKSVDNNLVSNQSSSTSQERADDLSAQVQDLKKQNSELVKENEAIKTNLSDKNDTEISQKEFSGQSYKDIVNYYSYLCPNDFILGNNLDFNGKIKVSECSKNYSNSKFEFIDGISVRFEFVPTGLSNTEMNGDKLWSDQKFEIKSTTGAKIYSRNSFSGWMSAAPENGGYGYINVIARRTASGGYYEVSSIIALNDNNNPTVEERMAIANKIVDSFLITK